MNGQMKNFDVKESVAKDKIASDFIEAVNPYRKKPSLGIDLRKLAKYVKETAKSISMLSETEMRQFHI